MRNFIILFIALTIAACGPVYSTRYHFTPPLSTEGRMCLNNCLSSKSMCGNNCNMNAQSCLSSIQWLKISQTVGNAMFLDKEELRKRKHYRPYYETQPFDDLGDQYNQEANRCEYQKQNCLSSCEFDYRACYQNCGGQVFQETFCSAFCQ